MNNIAIKRALVSVFHKEGLEPIVRELHAHGVELVSTGGTEAFIKELGLPCVRVEDLTHFPAMLSGRVKTLHPGVFGGILARRDDHEHMAQMQEHELRLIDLVIVDLYPFADTVANGGTHEEIIEKIDIGGISLIRAAAKNYKDVLIISNRDQYESFLQLLKEQDGSTTLNDRKQYALEAFAESSGYDTAIFNYFDGGDKGRFRHCEDEQMTLRYGENPHQQGIFFGDIEKHFKKIQGKELSYNNLQDVDAAVRLVNEFNKPTFVVVKHMNPCGVATRDSILEAWEAALACDPESAFGGILACNRTIDVATAEKIGELFFEVLIAPDFEPEALALLGKKKNRIILINKASVNYEWDFKSVLGGVLMQQSDSSKDERKDWECATQVQPSEDEMDDLEFGNIIAKHCKSNAVALVKDSCLCASGVGQTSRVAALRQAIEKAKMFGFDLNGAILASDAFLPFRDCVDLSHEAGVTAVVQPGGSIRDQESIDACNEHGMSMVFTGKRHFKH